MKPSPRPEVAGLAPVPHGGGAPSGVFDFSTGISPLPPPRAVLRAARKANLTRYPDVTAEPLCKAIAQAHEVAPEQVVAGAGSVELIWALGRAFGGPGRHALLFAPCFGEYAQAVRATGATCVTLASAPPTFEVDRDVALEHLRAAPPALAFLCRPANPTLSVAPPALLETLASAAPGTLFVVDEAYLLLFDPVPPIPRLQNVVLLRSLTKLFALPGVRLGYLIADPPVARAVRACLPPWNVSAPASAAGIAALGELERIPAIRRRIARLRERLAEQLRQRGIQIDAAGGPFLLCRIGDAAAVSAALLRGGVCVRDCSSFGLPEHIRIGVRPVREQARLLRALGEVIR